MAISDQNLELIPDYEQRVDVLKDLKFIDQNSTVLLKGRVACEINSANELVLTELILENTLAAYDPEEVVALLSCFVFQEKTEVEPEIPPKLQEGLEAITAIAQRVERVQETHKVPGEEFRGLKFGLVEVVHEWAKGMVRVKLSATIWLLTCSAFTSPSTRLPTSQTSPKVPLFVVLRGWMRPVVKYETRRVSLETPSYLRRWRRPS
jgi:superfamily II RNA helicase